MMLSCSWNQEGGLKPSQPFIAEEIRACAFVLHFMQHRSILCGQNEEKEDLKGMLQNSCKVHFSCIHISY